MRGAPPNTIRPELREMVTDPSGPDFLLRNRLASLRERLLHENLSGQQIVQIGSQFAFVGCSQDDSTGITNRVELRRSHVESNEVNRRTIFVRLSGDHLGHVRRRVSGVVSVSYTHLRAHE